MYSVLQCVKPGARWGSGTNKKKNPGSHGVCNLVEEVDNQIFIQLIKRLISTVVSGLLKMLYGLGGLAELFEEAPDSEEQVATFKSFLAIQHPLGLTLRRPVWPV